MDNKTRTILTNETKNTVGYSESTNKESFLIGVSVALSRAEAFYEKRIKDLEQEAEGWERACKSVDNDMRTLATIINRYTQQD
jgi:hypothetical protein